MSQLWPSDRSSRPGDEMLAIREQVIGFFRRQMRRLLLRQPRRTRNIRVNVATIRHHSTLRAAVEPAERINKMLTHLQLQVPVDICCPMNRRADSKTIHFTYFNFKLGTYRVIVHFNNLLDHT
jgi:hypothetical protein